VSENTSTLGQALANSELNEVITISSGNYTTGQVCVFKAHTIIGPQIGNNSIAR